LPKENAATQDTQSEVSPVNIIHLYLDENNLTPDNREDVMSEFDFIQESTHCSKELADFLKEAFGDAPYNGPFV